jgi:hypothetical protein
MTSYKLMHMPCKGGYKNVGISLVVNPLTTYFTGSISVHVGSFLVSQTIL